jgi:hypothetical protein
MELGQNENWTSSQFNENIDSHPNSDGNARIESGAQSIFNENQELMSRLTIGPTHASALRFHRTKVANRALCFEVADDECCPAGPSFLRHFSGAL